MSTPVPLRSDFDTIGLRNRQWKHNIERAFTTPSISAASEPVPGLTLSAKNGMSGQGRCPPALTTYAGS
jgi:hypothetical protein